MLPPTQQRVHMHTKPDVNERIERQTERNIDYYRDHRQEIEARLQELEKEWDVERALETQFSSVALLGVALFALTRKSGWMLLPAITGGFLLQHALQGWCPPVPVYRRLGVRTAREIEEERCALRKMLEKG